MAQEKITYADKAKFKTSPVDDNLKYRDVDANEVKNIINNNADDVDTKDAAQTAALTAHIDNKNDPHEVTKAQVGLGSADNTSDADKPISTAAAAKNLSQDNAIGVVDGKADQNATDIGTNAGGITTVQNNLTSHENNVSNPHVVTKGQVGLGNVDNTADSAKPVSTQTQAALNAKKDISASANVRAAVDIVSSSTGDFWLFRLPNTTQSREYVVVIQYHRPDDAGRFGKSVTLSVGLGNTTGLPERGGSIIQTGGFGIDSALTGVFVRFVGGQYYLGFTSALNGGTSRIAISVHGPDAQDVDFSVLNTAASGANIVVIDPLIDNTARSLLSLASFGYVRTDFDVNCTADNWYRIARLDAGSIWGEAWQIGLSFRNGNSSQGLVFGVGTTYNNARLGVHTNANATNLCKGVRVTWASPNWIVEFQAALTLPAMMVWGSIQTARVGVVLLEGADGGGQVYGNTITDVNVPTNNTLLLATPDVSQGYLAPPINDLGGEQDPPELSSAQAEAFNAEIAEAILTRMERDALNIAYAAEADLVLLAGTAYVQGIISTPPDNVIVDRSDYITNGVDAKYL